MNYISADLGPFSEEQVSRARRYHRPLDNAATVGLILDSAVLALIVFSRSAAVCPRRSSTRRGGRG